MNPLSESDCVVVKIGGSLLERRGLADALQLLAEHEPVVAGASKRVWIAGGGEAVEALRRIDAGNPLPESLTHRAAIEAMDVNAKLVAHWLTAERTSDWRRVTRAQSGEVVFAPGEFLSRVEPGLPGRRLPRGWSVTSDSIAARIAELLPARLALLKSRPCRAAQAGCWSEAAVEGYVDRHFPLAAERVTSIEVIAMGAGRPSS